MSEDKKPKIESITVMDARDLPKETRVSENISSEDGFVEVIVERTNPANTKIRPMGNESPGKKFSRLLGNNKSSNE